MESVSNPDSSSTETVVASGILDEIAASDTPIIPHVIVQEIKNDPKVGDLTGQCKWWSDKLGYGFITVQNGEMKGKDIFVHHSGIKPLNSNYKTLKKGEYINFDVMEGDHGLQAMNVTGIGGGSLICDVNPHVKHVPMVPRGSPSPRIHMQTPPPPPHTPHHVLMAQQQYSIPFDQHMMVASGRGTSRAYHHRPYARSHKTPTASSPTVLL